MSKFENLPELQQLHPIGDLCRVCGVTRRMILNYEEHGLIQPIKINESSGYRYYGSTSVARICHITALQRMGFSLKSIRNFLDGDDTATLTHLEKLEKLKSEVESQISRTKALLTEAGDFSVHMETLPAADFVITTKKCETSQERYNLLYAHTNYIFEKGYRVANTTKTLISILHTDPSLPHYGMTSAAWKLYEPNEESVHFEETKALCINIRGPYSQVAPAIKKLYEYAREHDFTPNGNIRMAYLTSPQSHSDPQQYVTQVFLPIL